MKSATLALLTLALAAAAALPLSRLRAAPAKQVAAVVQPADEACVSQEDTNVAPAPPELALPPGHPPVDLRLFLPPGHPPIGGAPGALPPGHPELPPGHPPIPSSPHGMPLPFGESAVYEI